MKAYDIFQPSGGFWDAAMRYKWFYSSSFVKLRELAISYALPDTWAHKVLAQHISIAGFMKNLILFAANKTNQDPESIYNQNPLTGSTEQGRNIWNASPIIMPVGLKLNVSF